MRIVIFLISVFYSFNSFSQFNRSKELFQVILADKVTRSGGKGIRSMEFLYKGDTVRVAKGGVLAMLHKSMYPVEISTDSVIVIGNLSKAIDSYVKLNLRQQKSPVFKTLNVSRLFALTPDEVIEERQRRRIYPIGAVHRSTVQYEIELFYPPIDSWAARLDFGNDICLEWRPIKGQATIEALSFMEEVLVSIPLSTNIVRIPKENLLKEKNEFGLLQIVDSTNRHTNPIMLYKFKNSIPYPYPCDLTKPSAALLVALGMEFANPPYLGGAEKYYTLATRLSAHPFYQQMLINFRERGKSDWGYGVTSR